VPLDALRGEDDRRDLLLRVPACHTVYSVPLYI